MTPRPASLPATAQAAFAALLAATLPLAAGAQSPGPASSAREFPPLRAGTTAPRSAAVPAVELLVDWRLVPAEDVPPPEASRGGVVVGTRSPVPPGWSATRSRDAAPPAVTTVRVTNGHEVAWRVDEAHVRPDYDFVWTAQGQGVVSHDTVVHAARSLRATPRWPGGAAPVALDLAVTASRPRGGTPQDPDREAALHTTVSMSFDEWLPVARLGEDEVQVRVRRR